MIERGERQPEHYTGSHLSMSMILPYSGDFSGFRNDIHIIACNWFVNRCPIVTRVPRLPIGPTTFSIVSRDQSNKASVVVQSCQTWQHPIRCREYPSPRKNAAPFDQNRMDALQDLMDEMEISSYYGNGEDSPVTGRSQQKGVRELLTTNRTTSPENASAYRPTDFIRDTLEKCRAGGGDPDVVLVSTNFMHGFAIWGHAVQRLNAGSNVFGTPIDVFESQFLGGVTIIEAPLLKPFTAICLTSSEIRLRMKRNEFWNPRGTRGDASEGDWIAEGAIEVEREQHHAWLEGVTAFSPN